MARKAKEAEEQEFDINNLVESFLDEKDNKDYHFNNCASVNYKVSSGSLNFDIQTEGGLGPGCYRFVGPRESGKTSAALEIARNFQEKFGDHGTVVYFKAEGRFSENIKMRSGLDFSSKRFQLIKSSIFEVISGLMDRLVKTSPDDHRILFIIDSVDGIITKADYERPTGESFQPGTTAKALSILFKKLGLAIAEMGHMVIFISQERTSIIMQQYAPKQQQQGKSAGGNAIQHQVDIAFEFKPVTKSRLIWENETEKTGKLGHEVEVEFLKSTNEKTYDIFSYPVRYGRKNGTSIWREREVAQCMLSFGFAKTSGKGVELSTEADLVQQLKTNYPDKFQEKFTYMKNFYAWFDQNPDISKWLFDKFQKTLIPK